MDSKRCSKCGVIKAASEFFVKDKKAGKLYSACKPCWNAYTNARYHANPVQHNAICIAWARNNRSHVYANIKAWRKANPERHRANQHRAEENRRPKKAAYRRANAERIKIRNAAYRAAKRDAIKASGQAYYLAHKDEINARIRKAVAAKPELYRQLHKAAKHRRRVRLEHAGPAEKFGDREIFERDGWVCGLCSKPVDPDLQHPDPMSASLDHRTPIAKGGGHTRANVQLAHLRCNLSKRDRAVASAA
jgi:hypothetical protein